ncbi:MAG: hypothetical protein IPM54_34625 [Polyangiaceae bacterium]|nr:hypothetical protein [Polyangiaceae bacterium]
MHLNKAYGGQQYPAICGVGYCSPTPANVILDRRFKGTDCTWSGCAPELAGVTVTTSEFFRASNGFNYLDEPSRQFCAGVFLTLPAGWTSGARINQKHAAHLLEPKIVSYLF